MRLVMRALLIAGLTAMLMAGSALAHFGMLIPNQAMVERPGTLTLDFLFWHPMENQGMNLAKPAEVGVWFEAKKKSLLPSLKPITRNGRQTWQVDYAIKRPGDYSFYMIPQPYWEPAEDCFIIHYTKVIVDAMGAENDWDTPVGLKMEIMPLTRPFGLYAGNSFTGQVLYKGKPLPNAEVEVEYFNAKGSRKSATGTHTTQVVKTDSRGVFTFAMPWGGWWGFAALHTDDRKIKHNGQDKDVEVGGVIWVYAHEVK